MSAPTLESRLARLQQMLAAALLLVFSASALALSYVSLARQSDRMLLGEARLLASDVDDELAEQPTLRMAADTVLAESTPPGVSASVVDASGRLVSVSPRRASEKFEGGLREASVPLSDGGWVVVRTSDAPIREALVHLLVALALTGLPLFAAVLLASRAISRRALAPLSRMARQAEAATAEGAPASLGDPSDPGEVAALARAFNRLIERREALLAAERHFARDAAHELRTPLMVVGGEIEHLLTDPSLSPAQRGGLLRAAGHARGMGDLVEALLLLGRAGDGSLPESAERGAVNLADLARDVTSEFQSAVPERSGDLRVVAGDEVLVAGHPTLLEAAVRNLVANALRFSPAGEPILIQVGVSDATAEIAVEDGGEGVRPEDAERIFDPFFRSAEARARHPGHGLGLAIIRRVARAHGGDVRVSRSALGGARFVLGLPCWRPPDR